jgi:hypothetical protein
MAGERTLAMRLGQSVHVSPLRVKLRRLMARDPGLNASCLEDWLLDLANLRGVRSVSRSHEHRNSTWPAPDLNELSNAELVIAISQPQNLDRPQWFRAAAELISRQDLDPKALIFLAKRERCTRILAELSRQALIAEADHPLWRLLSEEFQDAKPLSDSLIHWTRLTSKRADGRSRKSHIPYRPLAL